MVKRLIKNKSAISIILVSVVGIILLNFLGGDTLANSDKKDGGSAILYNKSVENMKTADFTFAELSSQKPEGGSVEYVIADSKTCSRRCSQRCSTTCTTTRGCSSRCKSYTEGCSGTVEPENKRVKSSNEKQALATIPRKPTAVVDTKELQMLLTIAGYDIKVSGNIDSNTLSALHDFQKRNNLPQASSADSKLWKTLCLDLVDAVD